MRYLSHHFPLGAMGTARAWLAMRSATIFSWAAMNDAGSIMRPFLPSGRGMGRLTVAGVGTSRTFSVLVCS